MIEGQRGEPVERKVINYASPTARPNGSGPGAVVIFVLNLLGTILAFVALLLTLSTRHDSLAQLSDGVITMGLFAGTLIGCLVPTVSYVVVLNDRLSRSSKGMLLVTGIAAFVLAGSDLLALWAMR